METPLSEVLIVLDRSGSMGDQIKSLVKGLERALCALHRDGGGQVRASVEDLEDLEDFMDKFQPGAVCSVRGASLLGKDCRRCWA